MKRIVAVLAIVWAAANVVVAYLFVTNAFVAKTAAKEGLPAQAALLLGGLLIAVFAVIVAREGLALFRGTSRVS
ncbi:MAG: hypothetical protein E6I64_01620 [Chloroflexi bacterium]|nr:MAG: hypothetical protein E6I64_01620 [Chloroflexota bacterium]